MFMHTVEYKDFNGNDRKDNLYFHLATHELTRIEAEIKMNLEEYIKELQQNDKVEELLAFLERMILSAYGEKSPDGKSFLKTQPIREAFEYSFAYAELFEQIILNPDLAQKFGENVSDNKNKKNQVAPQVVVDNKPTQ